MVFSVWSLFDCDRNRIARWKRLYECFIQQLFQVLRFSCISW